MKIIDKLNSNKQYIINEYINGASTCQLGKEMDCSNAYIQLFLRDNKIDIRQQHKADIYLDKVKELSEKQYSSYAICKELGLSSSTVSRLLKKLGNFTNNWYIREDPLINHKEDIINRYQNGESTCQIGKIYNCQDSSIVRFLQRLDIELRENRKYFYDTSFFEKITNENNSYSLGLMYTDGNNQDGIGMRISLTDLDVIEKLKKVMSATYLIKIINPRLDTPNHKTQYLLYINDKKISEDLTKLGCMPNKTFLVKFPTEDIVTNDLLRHFLRGVLDGDGSIVKNTTGELTIKFVGTEHFMQGIKYTLKNILDIDSSMFVEKGSKTGKIFGLAFGKQASVKKFLDWIYQDATIYMDRKYKRYKEHFYA